MNDNDCVKTTDPVLIIPNDIFFEQVREILDEDRYVTFTVKGCSMTPFLRNSRDRVVLEKYEGETLKKGAVVLFRYRGRYILHRIVGICPAGLGGHGRNKAGDGTSGCIYVLCGDGNLSGLEYAAPSDIIGIMTKRITPSGKEWRCDSFSWRMLSFLWIAAKPFRRILLAVVRRIWALRSRCS